MDETSAPSRAGPHPAGEVFQAFLIQGLTAFGGPVAHIGYFRREFVERRAWLSEAAFADLLALAQFLPGPASASSAWRLVCAGRATWVWRRLGSGSRCRRAQR